MRVAILGFGTVGKGVFEMIQNSVSLVCNTVLERPGVCNESFIVNDIKDIVSNDEIDAVVECIGGTTIAHEFAVLCLQAGKHFVTSNKALVSAYGLELQELAIKNKCAFLFSAACGGSMPILLNLSIAKKTDLILAAGGILNGTVNYILTKMQDENLSYTEALSQAQSLGYAEADPTADVCGLDTLRKVILLSAVGFDSFYDENALLCEGIQNIDEKVIRILRDNNLVLRLIGFCGIENEKKYAYVQPVAFENGAIESGVKLNLNMAYWIGKNCGKMTISGQGAGRYPTAANVLRDLTEVELGRRYMLSDKVTKDTCRAEKECKYILIENGKAEFTECMSVSSMFEKINNLRKEGKKVFFAALDKELK